MNPFHTNKNANYATLYRYDMTTGSHHQLVKKRVLGYTLDGDDLFYSTENGIFRATLTGENAEKLTNQRAAADKNIFRMHVFEGYLYYCNEKDGLRLYRIPVQGGDPERLTEDGMYLFQFITYRGNPAILYNVYAKDSESGLPMRAIYLNGEPIEELQPLLMLRTHHFACDGDFLYYCEVSENCALYRMDLRTFERQLLTSQIKSTRIALFDDWLVTAHDNKVPYALRLDGSEMKRLTQ